MLTLGKGKLLASSLAVASVVVLTAAHTGVARYDTDLAPNFLVAVDSTGDWVQNPLLSERTKGDPAAPITIYEVTDFACPWCREFYRLVLPSIEREYISTGKAKLIFVNLPLPSLHPNSPAAHEFAMCAAKQGRFWPVHDLLYQHQALWEPLDTPRDYFTLLADSAGLDLDELNNCFDSGSTRWIVQQEAESVAQQANITSTPSFIIETVLLAGFQPIENWRPILDSLYAAKRGGVSQSPSRR